MASKENSATIKYSYTTDTFPSIGPLTRKVYSFTQITRHTQYIFQESYNPAFLTPAERKIAKAEAKLKADQEKKLVTPRGIKTTLGKEEIAAD